MKYKVGDKVRIKNLDWYNKNKDDYGYVWCTEFLFTPEHSKYCGRELTISHITEFEIPSYVMEGNGHDWTNEMIEGLVEEEEIEFTEEDKYWCDIMSESDPTTYVLPEGYIFKDENGNVINTNKIVLEKKRKEYPKTYEECCDILQLEHTFELKDLTIDEEKLTYSFIRLKRCRDAYWKIAGEEMELGKPWEPDWNIRGYYAIARSYGNVVKTSNYNCDLTFVFPTEEMRDAFKENFDPDIEFVKELL